MIKGSWLGILAGILSREARDVLKHLAEADWQAAGSEPGHRPVSQTMKRLESIRSLLLLDLELDADRRICEMRKRPGRSGDLRDAFTCAFAACCEDHGGAEFHGGDGAGDRLRSEGAILTVTRRTDGKSRSGSDDQARKLWISFGGKDPIDVLPVELG